MGTVKYSRRVGSPVMNWPWLPEAGNQLLLTEYGQPGRTIEVAAEGNGFFYQVRQVRESLEEGRLTLARPAARPVDSLEIMTLLTRWERACQDGVAEDERS